MRGSRFHIFLVISLRKFKKSEFSRVVRALQHPPYSDPRNPTNILRKFQVIVVYRQYCQRVNHAREISRRSQSDYAWEKIMQTKQKFYGVVATAILKLSKVLDSDILVLLVVI